MGPYTENIDTDALNANLYSGAPDTDTAPASPDSLSGVASLSRVRLKKGVFDKFRLPVDVQEGAFIVLTS